METLDDKISRLLAVLSDVTSCAVAYSGGVDSAVVAKAAVMVLGDHAVAVTGTSDSLADGELVEARQTAAEIGIRHVVIETQEFENPDYVANAPDRCFHCKTELYRQLEGRMDSLGVSVLLNGANLDDLGDYRPGMQAAANYSVRSPLVEAQLTKQDVRAIAAAWDLPIWDKPATPCLSSRVAYGNAVTPQRLKMIDAAERFLRSRQFPIVRVRYHNDDLARIEVPLADLDRLCESRLRGEVAETLQRLGFRTVTIDLQGFRSGSLNPIVPLQILG